MSNEKREPKKKLGPEGLGNVWKKVFELMKKVTGDVDVINKGNLQEQVDKKVEKVEGKGLSANDYTDAEKSKLAGIAAGANKYTHPATHPATMITQDSDHRMVSDAKIKAWDTTYQQATGYVDSAIAELINGAPETLDTLKEIADAMAENQSVVEALDKAIGTKANQAELDTHTGNDTVHITAPERQKWNKTVEDVAALNTNLTQKQDASTAINTGNIDQYLSSSVIIKGVKIYSETSFAANSSGDVYFAVPKVSGYKCLLGIGGSSSNANLLPVRASNSPKGDGTLVLHYRNVATSTQTISDLYCNMIFIRETD